MPITSPAKLRTRFIIDKSHPDGRLELAIGAASRRLKKWVGPNVYADAISIMPIDSDRQADLELAESHLAMHFAILSLNTPISTSGIIKSAKVEDDAVLSYFTPTETRQISQLYLETAENIVKPYLFFAGTNEAAI